MKRFLKWLFLVVGSFLVLIVGFVFFFAYVIKPTVRPAKPLQAPGDEETVARGRYLVESVAACFSCHSQIDETQPGPAVTGARFAGRIYDPVTIPIGTVNLRAPNLTSAAEGLGNWTDGEVVRAIREGVSKDGRPLIPIMPYETYGKTLTEEDALAIVAYLRTIPPVPRSMERSTGPFILSLGARVSAAPVDREPIATAPGTRDRGEWVLQVAGCKTCHASAQGEDYTGGREGYAKGTIFAPNITQDMGMGIGAYSDEDIRKVLDEGTSRAGIPLRVMPTAAFRTMSDEDKTALIAALRAIPPKASLPHR